MYYPSFFTTAAPQHGIRPSVATSAQKETTVQQLWDRTAHRAFAFFWNETSPLTGLTRDRAPNALDASSAPSPIASLAATGYMLSALAIGVERGWVDRSAAAERALTALRFLSERMPHRQGFFPHFVDMHTGERAWKSEFSSIDTALLIVGARAVGQYFGSEIAQRAEALYARIDWLWMQGRRGDEPPDVLLKMGWKPERGFSKARWQHYDEASLLYLQALGAPSRYALPDTVWDRWGQGEIVLEGLLIPGRPGPLFWAQMTPGYYPLQGLCDRSDRAWWELWTDTHRAHHAYCARHPRRYPRHQEPLWGISACDQPPARPGGPLRYRAQRPVDGANDGTIAPTSALASLLFLPEIADRSLQDLFAHYGETAWGRYGFANAINPARNWFDTDVIGIDLGMMLLAVENHRTGLLWNLMAAHPATRKALAAAGFHKAR